MSSAHVEIADVSRRGIRRRIAVADASRLFFERGDRGVVGLGRSGKATKDGCAALVARESVRNCFLESLLVPAGDANQCYDAARAFVVGHDSLALDSRASLARDMRRLGELNAAK